MCSVLIFFWMTRQTLEAGEPQTGTCHFPLAHDRLPGVTVRDSPFTTGSSHYYCYSEVGHLELLQTMLCINIVSNDCVFVRRVAKKMGVNQHAQKHSDVIKCIIYTPVLFPNTMSRDVCCAKSRAALYLLDV